MASQSRLDCSDAAGLVSSISKMAVSFSRRRAAGQSRTVYAKVVECPSNLDLGFKIKVSIGELLAFT